MVRLVLGLLINSVALWASDFFVDGIHLFPFGDGEADLVLSYISVAAIFGVINAVIGNFIRIVAFPIYLLTLGLVALVVNGALFMLVASVTQQMGFGLIVDDFWWGVLGAVVMSVCNWILGVILRPFLGAGRG
ncbi:MAG: phage holin family protein [Microbacteriaceae bacterium]